MKNLLGTLVQRFLKHYLPSQKGQSTNTIKSYRDTIKLLLCYADDTLQKRLDQLNVEDLSEQFVLNFLDYLEQDRGCVASTRNVRLAAIRSLFTFITREEPAFLPQCQRIHTIDIKRTEHKIIPYLDDKEMQSVFEVIDINTRTGVRDKALLLLLYNSGARVSEIVNLEIDALRLDDSAQVSLIGKGKKQRCCPLWPETVEALSAYLDRRHPLDPLTKNVFLNANNSPITRFGIRYITRKYGSQAEALIGSKKVLNPHVIRHTTAMHLIKAGNDINMVKFWLGHASINTTHMYCEIDMEMKRKMLNKMETPDIINKSSWHKPEIIQWLENLTNHPQLQAVG